MAVVNNKAFIYYMSENSFRRVDKYDGQLIYKEGKIIYALVSIFNPVLRIRYLINETVCIRGIISGVELLGVYTKE